ncbi:MAG: 16S rRNA (cytosine(1402)-N(4))-methyltransferase RsmH [Xanthomonadales bacterium]|nr:16S rRNA (cytosine(1402)-N(4))-methyltransferase RsmH [Gammaproteobacteria bacterium]MBT8060746.1 16S rRNA (cytosine(1402)-N(4))-methyltransferase RsmH [Gammaproteobacteria bacterium]NNJ65952.1 16S rRNA (cytosine(1402)-N(4))-methyltransferase RsmH [Xanthomonadales bacterium]NNK33811.1 16S rRNA (cytosine(1402)-N(4))-methyltransferase RsmH [Xanthomonadales bacterium]NNK38032.1 16S rRNA (cytosine(1402)-N(4))-methyltransferase RsmH [Xanthomonadales bacterium]
MSDYQHRPVLLEEVVEALNIRPDGQYLDGTFGRGGHSRAILARLSRKGCLFSLDRDPEAVAAGEETLGSDPRFSIVRGNYADMERFVRAWGVVEGLDGILLDLGVSSPQLDDPDRGFSFMGEGPLDMRMNPLQGVSAKEWLAEAPERELTRVFWEFGEERFARRIARSIVMTRQKQRLETTGQLARLIENTIGRREKNKHPATRCFQAIRIFVNDEMAHLAKGLEEAIRLLRPGGRLVVISFHSLEDRLVKRTMKEAARPGRVRRNIPEHPDLKPVLSIVGKVIKPSQAELSVNPRARSAVMRIAEKLA